MHAMSSAKHKDLLNRDYCKWRDFLREAESWDLAQVERYQVAEVRRIVRHAYENTIGYRKLYSNAGVSVESIQSLADLQKIPMITKEMLQDDVERYSSPPLRTSYVTTGGSTGIPFGFYRDSQCFSKELASKAHQYYRIGWREGDRQLVLRGVPVSTNDYVEFVPEFNELRCSSYQLTPQWMECYRERACDYNPEWLRCYPSSATIFANFIKDTNREFPIVKGILCASENLYDFQKKLLSEVFKTRIFSHYGHYEMAVLAGFCEYEDTYHVLPQYGFAELLDEEGRLVTEAGSVGEIVGTSFIMHATPFIRYRTRDFAVLKSWGCKSCGRPYQVWERVEGRLQEFIITGSGRPISMTAINMHDDIFEDIRQFQFYQREKGELYFRFIPKETCRPESLAMIRSRLASKLGDDTKLYFQEVDHIPITGRGKHRFLLQELSVSIGDA